MCGIFCIYSTVFKNEEIILKQLLNKYRICKNQLERRGPDFQTFKSLLINNHAFIFAASVLWLQGTQITQQPIMSENAVFLYNGDIFDGTIFPEALQNERGDTTLLFEALKDEDNIVSTLSKLQGPYSFIYLNKQSAKLYFCRDAYGRRSLLIGKKGDDVLITSVSCKTVEIKCMELPTIGLFCYNLLTKSLEIVPWDLKYSHHINKIRELENLLAIPVSIKGELNITKNIEYICPTDGDLLLLNQLTEKSYDESFKLLLANRAWKSKVKTLQHLLEMAVKKRIATQPRYCHNCILEHRVCNHTLTGILFSGGIDCSILAVLANKFTNKTHSIDLLNVAFKCNSPDRLTGLETLKELRQLFPERQWNFIEIDVDEEELNHERNTRISDLIYPLNTILDDSLGCAMWFASRGQTDTYKSPCRVLLVGTGADELFGGYMKHRAAFKRDGWLALYQSLEDDWQNIAHRNLARDDRVVSDHGRQLRTPYLDENVVEFVRTLNCWERTFPSDDLPQGIGDKMLLRSLAYYLGLKNASRLRKRALQFGSRIANSKENASDISPRL